MDKKTQISPEDLKAINDAKANMAYAKALQQKAEAEAKTAEAEFRVAHLNVKNMLLMTYLNYGLHPLDQIDPEGKIVRNQGEEEAVDESK